MKKRICVLLLTLMTLFALPGFAAAPTEYAIPGIGTEIHGFTVTGVTPWATYATQIVELTHQKTGSVLYWIANDSIDRSFRIAFRTPVYDDTGIPHVFEHATLGGSPKYPGANTFFDMLSQTSHTFLNAQTNTCYTSYPMSTISEDQLHQYIDYYINGLIHPLALTNPYALMREAYRYELDAPDAEISLQGVVYSEMQGALTVISRAKYNHLKMLWPGSYVSSISGGDPRFIPDLTVDALQRFHDTYYHPSNATMYLGGDVNLPAFLEQLDRDFLSGFDKKEISIEDPHYQPLEPGYHEQVFSCPVESGAGTDHAAHIIYACPFKPGSYDDIASLKYVTYYLNDESSPFRRLILQRLPHANVSVTLQRLPEEKAELDFYALGVDESDKEVFRATCEEALSELLREGVNEETLRSLRVEDEFIQLLNLDSSSVYLSLGNVMASLWSTFGRRDAWKMQADFENRLHELITVDHLNELIQQYWSSLDTQVLAVTVPVPGLKEEEDAKLHGHLAEMKAEMSPEELSSLVEQTRAYHAFVEESNQISMPETLNALSASTLPEEVSYAPASETTLNGLRLITSEIDSPLTGIILLNEADVIPFSDLFDFLTFASLTGRLSTDLYTREELPSKASQVSYSLSLLEYDIHTHPDSRMLSARVSTSWFALPDTLEDSFALVEDILYHTDYSDYEFIRNDARKRRSALLLSLENSSPSRSISLAGSVYSTDSLLSNYLSSQAYIDYLDRVSRMTDAQMDELVAKFDRYRGMLLNRNHATLALMANRENLLRASSLGYHLTRRFDGTPYEKEDYASRLPSPALHSALVTGGNVAFNTAMTDLAAAGYDRTDGGLLVISHILNNKLLYPEVRVKHSAYGCYTHLSDYLFGFYSYRDPGLKETYDVFEHAGDFLRSLEISQEELEGYIVSSYSSLTTPMGPLSASLQGIQDLVDGISTHEQTLKMIRDMKAFRVSDIARYIPLVEIAGSAQSARATTGSKTLIDDNADAFDAIDSTLFNAAVEEMPESDTEPALQGN